MQSSYQYHFGGQAAAARNADSPNKSPQKSASISSAASQSQSGSSSMFVAKVDWGSSNGASGAAAANNHVPFGFGGSAVPFGGAGATNAAAKPSFGGPSAIGAAAASSGLGLSSQSSSRASAAASFGGPSATSSGSAVAAQPSFGGGGPIAAAAESRTGSAAGSLGGFGFSTSDWGSQQAAQHNTNCSSVKEYAYNEDRNQRFRPQMEDSK